MSDTLAQSLLLPCGTTLENRLVKGRHDRGACQSHRLANGGAGEALRTME